MKIIVALALLLLATPVFAQSATPPVDSSSMAVKGWDALMAQQTAQQRSVDALQGPLQNLLNEHKAQQAALKDALALVKWYEDYVRALVPADPAK